MPSINYEIDLSQYNAAELDEMLANGIITQAERDAWRQKLDEQA